ncbi:MAG TPA: hypothetical protein VFG54_05095 [Prolixibacteraceae bacterium]|nr:hypothetical protein [Prolixibacteraceae bacterium]
MKRGGSGDFQSPCVHRTPAAMIKSMDALCDDHLKESLENGLGTDRDWKSQDPGALNNICCLFEALSFENYQIN